ncbi:tapetal oleosin GRP-17-like [Cryptomeria japonica]|uniref:tapetal oleosin GRP-17-like n=1 Tax=Cryptomeria japonica TaxID=3369 RepID=UPI0027DA868C|nr:tapetal oleosin GRP-17-like [Cryptomeria japonica]
MRVSTTEEELDNDGRLGGTLVTAGKTVIATRRCRILGHGRLWGIQSFGTEQEKTSPKLHRCKKQVISRAIEILTLVQKWTSEWCRRSFGDRNSPQKQLRRRWRSGRAEVALRSGGGVAKAERRSGWAEVAQPGGSGAAQAVVACRRGGSDDRSAGSGAGETAGGRARSRSRRKVAGARAGREPEEMQRPAGTGDGAGGGRRNSGGGRRNSSGGRRPKAGLTGVKDSGGDLSGSEYDFESSGSQDGDDELGLSALAETHEKRSLEMTLSLQSKARVGEKKKRGAKSNKAKLEMAGNATGQRKLRSGRGYAFSQGQ